MPSRMVRGVVDIFDLSNLFCDAQYSLGIDYGTNPVLALLRNVANGNEVAPNVFDYPIRTDDAYKRLYCPYSNLHDSFVPEEWQEPGECHEGVAYDSI